MEIRKKNKLIEHAKAVSAFGPRVESITTRIEWDESWSRIASFSSRWIRYAISKSLTLSPIFDYKSFGCELLQIVRLLFCFFYCPFSLFSSLSLSIILLIGLFSSFNSFFNVNHGLNQAATGHKYLYIQIVLLPKPNGEHSTEYFDCTFAVCNTFCITGHGM